MERLSGTDPTEIAGTRKKSKTPAISFPKEINKMGAKSALTPATPLQGVLDLGVEVERIVPKSWQAHEFIVGLKRKELRMESEVHIPPESEDRSYEIVANAAETLQAIVDQQRCLGCDSRWFSENPVLSCVLCR